MKQTLATKTHALRDADAGQVLDARFFSGNGLVRSMTRNKVSSLLTRLDEVDGGQRSIASWFCFSLASGGINPLEETYAIFNVPEEDPALLECRSLRGRGGFLLSSCLML